MEAEESMGHHIGERFSIVEKTTPIGKVQKTRHFTGTPNCELEQLKDWSGDVIADSWSHRAVDSLSPSTDDSMTRSSPQSE